jgi:hypothetical protein
VDLPPSLKRLQDILLKRMGGDREMADILACVPSYGLDPVIVAVELALEGRSPSREHVFNLLARLQEQPAPEAIVAPQALTLKEEPQADIGRYDTLRVILPLTPLLPVLHTVMEVRHAA